MAAPQYGSSITVDNNGLISKSDPTSVAMRFLDIVNTITHFTLGAVACAILSFGILLGSTTLTQHMILCVLGYVVLMAQSILVMSSNNGWSRSYNDQERKTVHLVMQILGSVLAIAGSGIAMTEVYYHFTTAHGSLGLVAMFLTILSLIGGLTHFYTAFMPRVTHLLHCICGSLALIIAFAALITGINNVYRLVYSDGSAYFLITLTVIGLVGTLLPRCVKLVQWLNQNKQQI